MNSKQPWELVFPYSFWQQNLRGLLIDPGRLLVARLRRNEHPAARELLVEELPTGNQQPLGTNQPPLADWLVLACPRAGAGAAPQTLLDQLNPGPRQLLAALKVGLGPDRRGWQGWVVDNQQLLPLDALRVVGPGMIRAERSRGQEEEPDLQTLERYSRLRGALTDRVWRKVRQASVAIFGTSRTGSMVAFQMAHLGVKHLLLVDPDVVEIHQLDGMQGATEADVGRKKVHVLGERLMALRSDLALTMLDCSAAEDRVIDRVRSVDTIVTCVDSDTPRLAAALLAQRFLKVHLDIGTAVLKLRNEERVFAGDVRILLPQGQGCICCAGGLRQEKQAKSELLGPAGKRSDDGPRLWHEERAGSLVTWNALTVAVAMQMWLDLLAGQLTSSYWYRLRWQTGSGMNEQTGPVVGSKDCVCCGKKAAA